MNITGVDFIALPAEDFDASVDFYENTLGLERSIQWGEMPGMEFETGSLTLAIMKMDAFGQEHRAHAGPVAFHVEDVHAARAELEAKGVEFAVDTMDSGVCHMAHFRDPSGNPLMLHSRYKPRED